MTAGQTYATRRLSILFGIAVTAIGAAGCGSTPSPVSPTSSLTVTAVSPSAVGTSGGTAITVTGTGFGADTSLVIDGVPATGLTLTGTTSISATTPPHAAGAVSVVAISGGQSASFQGTFAYVAPSGANAPPVISSIRTTGGFTNQPSDFADIANTITVAAAVSDVETPLSQLAYSWTATAGTVNGSGATVSWTAPATFTSPLAVVLTLAVKETYVEAGVTQVNTTNRSFTMSVHDSQKEVLDLGQDFLDRFSQTALYPQAADVVHNFSSNCNGNEYDDVVKNRTSYIITAWSVEKQPPVAFHFGGVCQNSRGTFHADACSSFKVHWQDVMKALDPRQPERTIGSTGDTSGVDYVTAVLENQSWRLCESSYQSIPSPSPAAEPLAVLFESAHAFFKHH